MDKKVISRIVHSLLYIVGVFFTISNIYMYTYTTDVRYIGIFIIILMAIYYHYRLFVTKLIWKNISELSIEYNNLILYSWIVISGLYYFMYE